MEQASGTAGRHEHVARGDGMGRAGGDVVGDHTFAGRMIGVEYKIGHVPFLSECNALCHALLPEGEQNLVAHPVGGIGGKFDRGFAAVAGMASETPLGDSSILGTGEGDSVMLQVTYGVGGLLGQQLGGILIDEPIAAFHGVVVMPLPFVGFHVAEAGGYAAFGGSGMRSQGLQLGNHQHLGLDAPIPEISDLLAAVESQRCGQTGPARTHDHRIIHVFNLGWTHTSILP